MEPVEAPSPETPPKAWPGLDQRPCGSRIGLRDALWSSALPVAAAAAATATVGAIGADARWLVALGRVVVRDGHIPDGVPYAAAPSAAWHNVPVLSEVIFYGLWSLLGDRGLLLLQVAAVASGFALLAAAARLRAGGESATVSLLLVALGAVGTLAVIRVQLFSLVLFPALLLLLRAEALRPSRRVWLLIPLIALWSNLHGAVLLGLAVAAAYLTLARARQQPLVAAAVLAASVAALAATPAGFATFDYYRDVLQNEAARQQIGLWAPLSLHAPLDVLLVAVVVILVAIVLRARHRPAVWELAALAGLAFSTARTARTGVFLLFFLAAPVAEALDLRFRIPPRRRIPLVGALVALTCIGLVRGPILIAAHGGMIRSAIARADGTPILAEDALAEQVALAGGRVWIGNPLDAFPMDDQRLYVEWLRGSPDGDAALRHARRAVLVHSGSRADRRLRGSAAFVEVSRDDEAALYIRARFR